MGLRTTDRGTKGGVVGKELARTDVRGYPPRRSSRLWPLWRAPASPVTPPRGPTARTSVRKPPVLPRPAGATTDEPRQCSPVDKSLEARSLQRASAENSHSEPRRGCQYKLLRPRRTRQMAANSGIYSTETATNQVSGAKALNPKGLRRQHPSRFCWLAWRGCRGQDHGTRPRVQARYHLCATYMLAIAPEVDPINLGSNS
jgi:hypothetical protein